MIKVIIGIQARSTSKRFPGKVFEKIDGREILQHVLDSCEESSLYINKYSDKNRIKVSTVILVPENDEIVHKYRYKTVVFEGPEEDVLGRYYKMYQAMNPDYIVRVTSDCPLLPSYIISKHINIATKGNYDYVSNIDENLRTCVDGHDVEVMSRRALEWLNTAATWEAEREHVTPLLRSKSIPSNFKVGHVIGHLYQPNLKLSVDTPEDLERVRREYAEVKGCIEKAIAKSGGKSVYRI
jgi:spore coat polysaccharide biosynthesis protein SpsF (cytidylyltransferase family)